MNAAELARMLDTWSDALNVAEVVDSPFLCKTDQWDLCDWQTVDLPDGVKFEHLGQRGRVTEAVLVVNALEGKRQLFEPALVQSSVPTWLVRLGMGRPRAGGE